MTISSAQRQVTNRVLTLISLLSALLLGTGLSTMSANAATVTSTLQGESMTSVQRYGVRVKSDSLADGGKYLFVNSAVTATGTFNISTATDQILLRLKTDSISGGGASVRISIDGLVLSTLNVSALSWSNYTLTAPLVRGSHTLNISFLNPSSRNLYIDRSQFLASGATSTPTPTATSTPIPSATPTPTGAESVSQAYITGYSYWDNTPAGSSTISDPVLHKVAGGIGTYADPITIAVGHSIINGVDILDFPKGTRFYIPNLRRYFIVEDTCGDGNTPQNGACHTGYPSGASFWLDVWVGGGTVSSSVSNSCMNAITDIHRVIKNPASNYAVVSGEISASCLQYGETTVVAAG